MRAEKPIIYLDCPEYFTMRGMDPPEYWSIDFGNLLSKIDPLPETTGIGRIYNELLARNPGT